MDLSLIAIRMKVEVGNLLSSLPVPSPPLHICFLSVLKKESFKPQWRGAERLAGPSGAIL